MSTATKTVVRNPTGQRDPQALSRGLPARHGISSRQGTALPRIQDLPVTGDRILRRRARRRVSEKRTLGLSRDRSLCALASNDVARRGLFAVTGSADISTFKRGSSDLPSARLLVGSRGVTVFSGGGVTCEVSCTYREAEARPGGHVPCASLQDRVSELNPESNELRSGPAGYVLRLTRRGSAWSGATPPGWSPPNLSPGASHLPSSAGHPRITSIKEGR